MRLEPATTPSTPRSSASTSASPVLTSLKPGSTLPGTAKADGRGVYGPATDAALRKEIGQQ
jgi:hypothetical protein